MSKDVELGVCPCCNEKRVRLIQDKVHMDWSRDCDICGYSYELMPRASTRNLSNKYTAKPVKDFYECVSSGFNIAGSVEDLFEEIGDANS